MQYKTEYLIFRDYDMATKYCGTPIYAAAEVWTRKDSDSAWEFAASFYLYDYTDIYAPSYEQVYQGLLNENNQLAHLIAYDMPSGIFENVE